MTTGPHSARVLLGTVALLLGAGGVHRWAHVSRAQMEATFRPLALPLAGIPAELGPYTNSHDIPLSAEVLRVSGVDSFLNREYVDTTTGQRVQVYVGYWGRQNVAPVETGTPRFQGLSLAQRDCW